MIRASELRIGNWVDGGVNGSLYYRIKASDFVNTDFTKTKPIPLTPDILVNWCGFNKCYESKLQIRFENKDDTSFEVQFWKQGKTMFLYKSERLTNIEYIHQLQNLYYALTQTELEINL